MNENEPSTAGAPATWGTIVESTSVVPCHRRSVQSAAVPPPKDESEPENVATEPLCETSECDAIAGSAAPGVPVASAGMADVMRTTTEPPAPSSVKSRA